MKVDVWLVLFESECSKCLKVDVWLILFESGCLAHII